MDGEEVLAHDRVHFATNIMTPPRLIDKDKHRHEWVQYSGGDPDNTDTGSYALCYCGAKRGNGGCW